MGEMSCEEARTTIYRALDGESPPSDVEMLRNHVQRCEKCGREYELARGEAGAFKKVLAELVEEMPPAPEGLWLRGGRRKVFPLRVVAWAAAAAVLVAVGLVILHEPTGVESGALMVNRLYSGEWERVNGGVALGPGDSLMTGLERRVAFDLTRETRVALKDDTRVRFGQERLLDLRLERGEVWVKVGEGERVVVALRDLVVEGEVAEFVVFSAGKGEELRVTIPAAAWAGEDRLYEVSVLEGEVLVRGEREEWVLSSGKKLVWKDERAVISDLAAEEVSELKWVERFPEPYTGREVSAQVGRVKYEVLNPFGVEPGEESEK